jgi:hypothetical protein
LQRFLRDELSFPSRRKEAVIRAEGFVVVSVSDVHILANNRCFFGGLAPERRRAEPIAKKREKQHHFLYPIPGFVSEEQKRNKSFCLKSNLNM